MKLLFLRKNPTETVIITYLFIIGFIGFPYLEIGGLFTDDPILIEIIGLGICRLVATCIMFFALYHLGLGNCLFPRVKHVQIALVTFPALLIACNNLPWIAILRGTAGVSAPAWYILSFMIECIFVAAFEEISFRGIIFPLLLQRFGTERSGRVASVLISSAMFALLHLVNLFSGASLGSVVLQVGYSFLIGAMFSVILFDGGDVISCALLHALYNFCGLVVPTLGFGSFLEIWNPLTIAITVTLSMAVIAFMLFRLLYSDDASARAFVFSYRRSLMTRELLS